MPLKVNDGQSEKTETGYQKKEQVSREFHKKAKHQIVDFLILYVSNLHPLDHKVT